MLSHQFFPVMKYAPHLLRHFISLNLYPESLFCNFPPICLFHYLFSFSFSCTVFTLHVAAHTISGSQAKYLLEFMIYNKAGGLGSSKKKKQYLKTGIHWSTSEPLTGFICQNFYDFLSSSPFGWWINVKSLLSYLLRCCLWDVITEPHTWTLGTIQALLC